MNTNPNLTPDRSRPSVWDVSRRPGTWQVAALLSGAVLITGGMATRRRWKPVVGGLAVLALGLFGSAIAREYEGRRSAERSKRRAAASDVLDDALMQTFPASDPVAIA